MAVWYNYIVYITYFQFQIFSIRQFWPVTLTSITQKLQVSYLWILNQGRHFLQGGKGREGKGGTVATSLQKVFHAIVMTKQFVCTGVCYRSATHPHPSLVFHFLECS